MVLVGCQTHLQTVVLLHLLLVISEVSLLQADLAHPGRHFHLDLGLMVLLTVALLDPMALTINLWVQDHQDLTILVPLALALVQGLTMVLWVLMVQCMALLLTSWTGNNHK